MSKQKYIWPAVRSVLIIAIAALLAIKARELLLTRGDIHIPSFIYTWIVYVFIVLVVWLSTRKLFQELKADANEKVNKQYLTKQPNATETSESPLSDTDFRYPAFLGFLVLVVAIYWFSVPFYFLAPKQSSNLSGFLLFFGLGIATLWYGVHCFRYRVRITASAILIRNYRDHEYALSEIRKIDIVSSKVGPVVVVTLASNEKLRFSKMLKGFDNLVRILQARQELQQRPAF
jgi:hypothetical protein